jgi:hypothetical protein
MQINLNETSFNEPTGSKAINGGKSGAVKVTFQVAKKLPADAPNTPDWKILFKDDSGRPLNEGYYYLKPTSPNYEKAVNVQGRILKHMVQVLYGEAQQFPVCNTSIEMLDNCMAMIANKAGTPVTIGVSYGTIKRPNRRGYLQLKSTFPFMTIGGEITFNSEYDLMERPEGVLAKQDTTNKTSEKAPWD